MDVSYLNTKRLRKENKMTLRELSSKSGLSISFLSNYENGKVNITIAALYKIAQSLGVPIKALLATEEDHTLLVVPRDKRYAVIQHEDKEGAAIQEFLTRGETFDMQVTVMHIPPHMNSGSPAKHNSEEFMFILTGTVILKLNLHEHVKLHVGDMAYYDANLLHGWENPSSEPAEFLLVASKTGF